MALLERLRYSASVAEERHFGRAAERLLITQPSPSQQIKRLEAELGVQLLERDSQGLELTSAGETLLARVRPVLLRVQESQATETPLPATSLTECVSHRFGSLARSASDHTSSRESAPDSSRTQAFRDCRRRCRSTLLLRRDIAGALLACIGQGVLPADSGSLSVWPRCRHHGIGPSSFENVPVGPLASRSARRTGSRAACSTLRVPKKLFRPVAVTPGSAELTLMPTDSRSAANATVSALRATFDTA